jgi:RNA 2',3'-cyclic 3'-phosphodiesterase
MRISPYFIREVWMKERICMRLFIALNFDDAVKDKICAATEMLRPHTAGGNFTLRENLHLTLVFIGESTRLEAVKSAMNSINGKEFTLIIKDFGSFSSDNGKVCWLGIERSKDLLELQTQINDALCKEGFKLESRPFNPHLTIGREVILKDGFGIKTLNGETKPITVIINRVSLMKSERAERKLVYTEICNVSLTE